MWLSAVRLSDVPKPGNVFVIGPATATNNGHIWQRGPDLLYASRQVIDVSCVQFVGFIQFGM